MKFFDNFTVIRHLTQHNRALLCTRPRASSAMNLAGAHREYVSRMLESASGMKVLVCDAVTVCKRREV